MNAAYIAVAAILGFVGKQLWDHRKSMAEANPSYNLMKASGREEARRDLTDELQAIHEGRWPRNINDSMRWNPPRYTERPEKYVEKLIVKELQYLDELERRIRAGDTTISGYAPQAMANPKRRKKAEPEAISEAKQRDAIKLWRAGADGHVDGEQFELELGRDTVFITGTVYDGRRVTMQVGWDSKGSFVYSGGDKYRYYDSERRPAGDLVLDRYSRNPTEPGMRTQTLLFSRAHGWNVKSAKAWAKEHKKRYGSVDVKPNTIYLRQGDPSKFRRGTQRTIPFGTNTGIQAVVAKPR